MLLRLDPILHSELRLMIMALLMESDSVDFVFLREKTGATSGNVSLQLDKLKGAGYVEIEKGYKGRRPCTTCRSTEKGICALKQYRDALDTYFIHLKR